LPTTFLVTTTDDSGDGSLRQAILDSNNDTTGTNTIDFDITTGFGDVKTIQPPSPLPVITQPVIIDGTSQPGLPGLPRIIVNGSQAGAANGLTIRAGNSTVRGLVINGFQQRGISLEGPAGNNLIAGNYLGTNSFGGASVANGGDGVAIVGSNSNTIGGTTLADRNVISGNTGAGISISANAAGNVIEGNYIGVDVTSYSVLGNGGPGVSLTGGANSNIVGGNIGAAANVISGNGQEGVAISGGITTQTNAIQGNFIGTDIRGIARVPNTLSGVAIRGGASHNIIGGAVSAARNVISANSGDGILLTDSGTTGNLIQGNVIGTNANGTAPLANGSGKSGINITNGASGNTIGGTTSGTANVVSGNSGGGISLSGNATSANLIESNLIGTDISGTAALSNTNAGIDISNGANGNTIGGASAGTSNVISGNNGSGISLSGSGVVNNVIQGNAIGTDISFSNVLGNRANGITITKGASNNTIGGTAAGAGNVISGNAVDGIAISSGDGSATRGNLILGNDIGTDGSGSVALSNYDGILIRDAQSTANTIGGTSAAAANLVAGNLRDGIQLYQTPGNLVVGNDIGTDSTGSLALGNGRNGIFVSGSSANHNTLGGEGTGAANVIGYNGFDGIFLGGDTTGANVALANSLFSDTRLGIESANMNYPVLASAVSDGSSITITGTVSGSPGDTLNLEFFSNATCNPSGFGEGQTYLGSLVLTMEGTDTASFTVTFPVAVDPSMFITATSTGTTSNTSEFSQCLQVTASGSPRGKAGLLIAADRHPGVLPAPLAQPAAAPTLHALDAGWLIQDSPAARSVDANASDLAFAHALDMAHPGDEVMGSVDMLPPLSLAL
jgi:titin